MNLKEKKMFNPDMYYDTSIVIEERLPEILQNDFVTIEKAIKENDEFAYLLTREGLEVSAKACWHNGTISENTFWLIYHKVGLYYDRV